MSNMMGQSQIGSAQCTVSISSFSISPFPFLFPFPAPPVASPRHFTRLPPPSPIPPRPPPPPLTSPPPPRLPRIFGSTAGTSTCAPRPWLQGYLAHKKPDPPPVGPPLAPAPAYPGHCQRLRPLSLMQGYLSHKNRPPPKQTPS